MNAWLKRCVFNLDLNRESVSEPRTLSGRLFQSLGARYEKVLPPVENSVLLKCRKLRREDQETSDSIVGFFIEKPQADGSCSHRNLILSHFYRVSL